MTIALWHSEIQLICIYLTGLSVTEREVNKHVESFVGGQVISEISVRDFGYWATKNFS